MKWIAFFLGCLTCGISLAEMRTWTSSSGKTLEAEYISDAGVNVTLKGRDGKRRRIPISALSKPDQAYIYNKKPPRLEIDVDAGMKRKSVRHDIDNKKEDIQLKVKIRKTSTRPYIGELTAHLFVIGIDLGDDEYELLDVKKETFELTAESMNTHSFKGSRLKLEHDPHPGWGMKYYGYLLCVKGVDGQIILCKGKKAFEKQLNVLMEAEKGDRFDEDMRTLAADS